MTTWLTSCSKGLTTSVLASSCPRSPGTCSNANNGIQQGTPQQTQAPPQQAQAPQSGKYKLKRKAGGALMSALTVVAHFFLGRGLRWGDINVDLEDQPGWKVWMGAVLATLKSPNTLASLTVKWPELRALKANKEEEDLIALAYVAEPFEGLMHRLVRTVSIQGCRGLQSGAAWGALLTMLLCISCCSNTSICLSSPLSPRRRRARPAQQVGADHAVQTMLTHASTHAPDSPNPARSCFALLQRPLPLQPQS